MKGKKSKNIISKIGIIGCLVTLLPLLYLLKNRVFSVDYERKIQKLDDFSPIISGLYDVWRHGDIEDSSEILLKSCSDIPDSFIVKEKKFYECNPYYLKCFLNQSTKYKTRNFTVLPSSGVRFDIELNSQVASVKFENICRDTYLPQKTYSAGPKGKNEFWDNYAQSIFIDIRYVNKFDIYLWQKYLLKNNVQLLSVTEPLAAETSFTLKKQEQFCDDRGGQLLESRVLDAASFYPEGGESNDYFYKYKYPWGRKTRKKAKKLGPFLCENYYVKGCDKYEVLTSYTQSGLSWIGLLNSLGGHAEVVNNLFIPKMNLKASNKNLGYKSKWHEVGKRSQWSGLGFTDIDFKNKINKPISTNKVAFRCMYKI